MKDEIKEIKISKSNHSIVIIKNGVTVKEQFAIDDEILDYITNLQEENKEYKILMSNIDMNSVDYVYNKDTKLYTFDRKNWYKINKKLDERFNYKQRNKKAIKCIKDKYYKEEYEKKGTFTNKLINILQGSDK